MERIYHGAALPQSVNLPSAFTRIRRVIGGFMMLVGLAAVSLEMYKAPERFDRLIDFYWPLFVISMVIFGLKTIWRFVQAFWREYGF